MDNIEEMLMKIEPIIMNCRKKTMIPSWEKEDYIQEGMIIALEIYNELLVAPPKPKFNFYTFFKVRFSCYLIDCYRKYKTHKRKYNQLTYIDLSETTNVFDRQENVAENVMYNLLYQEISSFLTEEELLLFQSLRRGEKIDRNKKYRIKKKIIDYIKKHW